MEAVGTKSKSQKMFTFCSKGIEIEGAKLQVKISKTSHVHIKQVRYRRGKGAINCNEEMLLRFYSRLKLELNQMKKIQFKSVKQIN